MLPENAIEVINVSKKFKVYYDKGITLKEKVLFEKRRKYEDRVVLDDISFQVKKGEAIGLIGHNGCGKSTTLKLLTRIMYPDSGSIEIKGRVSSLIELGAGFHPDMTGRENIYINAAIFGLTRREIDARLQEIIDFSELQEFIDNPVRTYSSGMYMRLAFSVAINVDADVLLIDEILGVGDANFQVKCFNKLKEIKKKGTTIVIVSHSLNQIEQICERSLWLQNGKIREDGLPKVVHAHYLNFMSGRNIKLKGDNAVKENYMEYEYYDYVISLGDSCEVAEQLKRLELRTASYPFDWLFTHNIDKLIEALETNFSEWLLEENLIEEPSITKHRKLIDTKYQIEHQHLFPREKSVADSYTEVMQTVNRRIQRLLSLYGKKILFIRSCKRLEKVEELEQVLVRKFGENIHLLILIRTHDMEIKQIKTNLKYTEIYEIYREIDGPWDIDTWKGYSPHYDTILQKVRVNSFYVYLNHNDYFLNFWNYEQAAFGKKFRWTKESSRIDLRKFIGCRCKIRIATPISMKVFLYDINRKGIATLNIAEKEEYVFQVTYETRFITIEPEFTWTPKEKFGHNDERKLGVCLEEIHLERVENN